MVKATILADRSAMFSGITVFQEMALLANAWWQNQYQQWDKRFFQLEIASIDGDEVKGGSGLYVRPHKSIFEVDDADIILIPPFLPRIRWVAQEMREELQWLTAQHKKGTPIAAMCTGTFLLAQTGLLDGKSATTNWQFARSFKRRFPKVRLKADEIITEEDGLICTGASSAYMDLGLYIIEKFGNKELATNCSKSLLLDPSRRSQAPYIIFDRYQKHSDEKVIEAQKWFENHFEELISVDDVAKMLGFSPRQFQRRFKEATGESPLNYLQKIRIEVAKQKLETTKETFGEITFQVGYEDVNSFRKLFKKHTSLSPTEYRTRFNRSQQIPYGN